jgi:hypothetical protein
MNHSLCAEEERDCYQKSDVCLHVKEKWYFGARIEAALRE